MESDWGLRLRMRMRRRLLSWALWHHDHAEERRVE